MKSALSRALFADEDVVPLAALALLNFLLVLVTFHLTLAQYPGTGDEFSVLFQSRIFASMDWTAPAPAPAEPFLTDYIAVRDGRWFSIYPPAYALILAVGQRLGSVQAVVAALSSAALVFCFLAARLSCRDREIAWLTAALLCAAPSFRFYSASYYTHVGSLLAVTAALYLCLRIARGRAHTAQWLALALLATLGLAIRPFEAFWALLPMAAFLWSQKSAVLRRAVPVLLVIATVATLLLSDGAAAAWDSYFGPYLDTVNSGGRLSVWRGLTAQSLSRVCAMLSDTAKWLLAYGVFPSGNLKDVGPGDMNFSILLLAAGFAYVGAEAAMDAQRRRGNLLLLAVAASVVLGHLFYDKQGGRYGERRLLEAAPVFCLVTARMLHAGLSRSSRAFRMPVLAALFVPNLAAYLPATMLRIRDGAELRMNLYLMTETRGIHDSLILVKSFPDFYPSFYARNDPYLRGNIFVPDGALGERAARMFPDRARYVYAYDAVSATFDLRPLGPARAYDSERAAGGAGPSSQKRVGPLTRHL